MRSSPRVAALLALALAAGCSRSLAPDPHSARHAARSASAGTGLKISGTIVTLDANHVPRVDRHVGFFVPPIDPSDLPSSPRDTVPAHSTLVAIQWGPPGAPAFALREGTGETPEGGAESSGDTPAALRPEDIAPGIHLLTVDAPPGRGGGTVTFFFNANFTPDSWWAGPDPSLWPAASDGDGRAVDVTDWARFTTAPAWPPDGRGYFGPDSLSAIPSSRRPVAGDVQRRTFYEIFGDRIYARSEGDDVHLDSWIVVINGGYDKDSEYVPRVVAGDPALPADFVPGSGRYPVLENLGLVGSPSAFRMQASVRLPDGRLAVFARTIPYPCFDPNSVFRAPVVAGYFRANLAGKVYLAVLAEDSHGALDIPPGSLAEIADRVDAGGGTPAERAFRRKILVFNVRPAAGPRM